MSKSSALSTLGKVTSATRDKAEELWDVAAAAGFKMTRLWGMGSAGSEHPTGRALDLMITGSAGGKAAGDFLAAYLWANRKRLGVKWIIWNRTIRSTSPGKPSTPTRYNGSNPHTDHVHVFFTTGAYTPPKVSGGGGGSKPEGDGIPGTWEVDPNKVSSFLWGLKHGKTPNIKAKPGRNIAVVKQVTDKRRTWLVTAHDNWFAKAYLRKVK